MNQMITPQRMMRMIMIFFRIWIMIIIQINKFKKKYKRISREICKEIYKNKYNKSLMFRDKKMTVKKKKLLNKLDFYLTLLKIKILVISKMEIIILIMMMSRIGRLMRRITMTI